jgi:plasmid maintenance system antidote protein VapI
MGNRYMSAVYRELGEMLRQARKQGGLSSERLADMLGWSSATVSRMETGHRASTTTDVIQYLVMCGMKAPDVWPIVEFTRLVEHKQGYYLSDERINGSLQSLIFHESSAEHSIVYEPLALHGLLQTTNYTRAYISAINPDVTEEILKGAVRTRTERRRVLSVPKPGRFTFFVHEHALRMKVGTNEIMTEQLLHIVFTAALDNVSVRIVPSAAVARTAFGGSFRLMEFHEHRPIVYLDSLQAGLILEDPDHVSSYQEVACILADAALDEGQSREFVAELADVYDRGSQGGAADGVAQEQLQQ